MVVTIINDCTDVNAKGRQHARVASLFHCPVHHIDVCDDLTATGSIEAGANLIDVIDVLENESVILVNTAPRNGEGKKWPNGTPFCYFWVNRTLVVSSISGYTLSLIKKFHIADSVNMLDVSTVLSAAIEQSLLKATLYDHIVNSQFRSLEFLPRVAHWLSQGYTIPSEILPLTSIADAPGVVWSIDNFGNCKTTLLPEEVRHVSGTMIQTRFGTISCFNRLKDVPEGEKGMIIGSSGYGNKRFLEIVLQGASAAKHLGISIGAPVLVKP